MYNSSSSLSVSLFRVNTNHDLSVPVHEYVYVLGGSMTCGGTMFVLSLRVFCVCTFATALSMHEEYNVCLRIKNK